MLKNRFVLGAVSVLCLAGVARPVVAAGPVSGTKFYAGLRFNLGMAPGKPEISYKLSEVIKGMNDQYTVFRKAAKDDGAGLTAIASAVWTTHAAAAAGGNTIFAGAHAAANPIVLNTDATDFKEFAWLTGGVGADANADRGLIVGKYTALGLAKALPSALGGEKLAVTTGGFKMRPELGLGATFAKNFSGGLFFGMNLLGGGEKEACLPLAAVGGYTDVPTVSNRGDATGLYDNAGAFAIAGAADATTFKKMAAIASRMTNAYNLNLFYGGKNKEAAVYKAKAGLQFVIGGEFYYTAAIPNTSFEWYVGPSLGFAMQKITYEAGSDRPAKALEKIEATLKGVEFLLRGGASWTVPNMPVVVTGGLSAGYLYLSGTSDKKDLTGANFKIKNSGMTVFASFGAAWKSGGF